MSLSNKISFNLPVLITKQNKNFIAYTPALDLSTSGKSEKDVRVRFVEIVNLFIEEIIEAGTINDVLYELGWKKVQNKWTPPKIISSKSLDFKIPVVL